MRTALILLFLLALGSVPGSVLPQQGINPLAVQQYYAAHPALAPWLARFSLFNVFAAPWFAAIYLLLFLSLAGCVVPRTFRLAGSARQQPPRAPGNLSRLPLATAMGSPLAPDAALAKAAALLAAKRYRVRTGDGWVSAEKGYLREAGNLLFHLALLGLLAAVGLGTAWLGGFALLAAPHRALLLAGAAVCLVGAAVLLWQQRKAAACSPGAICARPVMRGVTVIGLLVGLALLYLGYAYA